MGACVRLIDLRILLALHLTNRLFKPLEYTLLDWLLVLFQLVLGLFSLVIKQIFG